MTHIKWERYERDAVENRTNSIHPIFKHTHSCSVQHQQILRISVRVVVLHLRSACGYIPFTLQLAAWIVSQTISNVVDPGTYFHNCMMTTNTTLSSHLKPWVQVTTNHGF